ncbi:N-methyl-L-tryptophan oxidase [Caulobacter sp. KR2-114]|uniref:N-methyl-L-tryptophan oxidase n=1 Tax=Caulobacter sp. KR2-114 TaxID=3400912 RepID=UPI003BFF34A1
MDRFDVAVVGLGAMGAAALYHLARQGRRVIGLDRAAPGHEGGSSHGESRIIRLAQFENPAYTPLVERAWALWDDLGRAGGEDLIWRTGMLEGGLPGTPIIEGSLRAARENGLPHEALTAAQARARFPAFDLPDDWSIVFQPQAGLVRADLAMRLHMAGARTAGAVVREGAVVQAIEPGGSAVRLVLASGEAIAAEAVIVAAGGWIGELVPELAPWLTVTRQAVCWFTPARAADTGPDRMPVFVLEDETEALYGFPDFMGTGVKAASHRLGQRLGSASDARQDAGPSDAQPIAEALARLIPGAAGPLKTLKTCLYTSTPDDEFIIDRHPADPRIILCSACSGHGFKFASAFGEALAQMTRAEGVPAPFRAFGLGRFGSLQASLPPLGEVPAKRG